VLRSDVLKQAGQAILDAIKQRTFTGLGDQFESLDPGSGSCSPPPTTRRLYYTLKIWNASSRGRRLSEGLSGIASRDPKSRKKREPRRETAGNGAGRSHFRFFRYVPVPFSVLALFTSALCP